MPITCTAITGKENHMHSNLQVDAFLLPANEVELPLWSAARMNGFADVTMIGVGSRAPSLHGVSEQIGGNWRTNQFTIGDGHIIKFTARKKSGGFGSVPNHASIYLRARETAALIKVSCETLKEPGRSTRDTVEITGRFDILSFAEVAATGRKMTRFAAFQSGATKVHPLFHVQEIEPALEVRQQVTQQVVITPDGESKIMSVATRRRALKL